MICRSLMHEEARRLLGPRAHARFLALVALRVMGGVVPVRHAAAERADCLACVKASGCEPDRLRMYRGMPGAAVQYRPEADKLHRHLHGCGHQLQP